MRKWFTIGAWLAALAVAAGAFGAHVLRDRISVDLLGVYETAVRYHLVHAVALLAVGLAVDRRPSRALHTAGALFVIGIVLFSGSLYALALSGVDGTSSVHHFSGMLVLGAITPFGGLALIAGWIVLALAARRMPES